MWSFGYELFIYLEDAVIQKLKLQWYGKNKIINQWLRLSSNFDANRYKHLKSPWLQIGACADVIFKWFCCLCTTDWVLSGFSPSTSSLACNHLGGSPAWRRPRRREDSKPSAGFSWAPAGPPCGPARTHSGAWRLSAKYKRQEEGNKNKTITEAG